MNDNNADNVKKWRENGGNQKQNELYSLLRNKYKIPSTQACKMKYWSKKRIRLYLIENDYEEVGDI